MQSLSGFRWRWPVRRAPRTLPYDVAEAVLIVALVTASVALFWVLVRPMGPFGRWQAVGNSLAAADPTILTRFDPFFRSAPTGPAAVTSLALKLFGTRLDQAMGRGSAIIATPDGLQSSFAVGDEIVPGVRLKSVAFDNVTIERGGASEQLFLDQSVGGAAAAAPTGPPPLVTTPATPRAPLTAKALIEGISFVPRIEKGAVTGFQVGPKGAADVFIASGLQQGDVVTQINGAPIRSAEDAMGAVGGLSPQARVSFTVERGGKPVVVTAGGVQ